MQPDLINNQIAIFFGGDFIISNEDLVAEIKKIRGEPLTTTFFTNIPGIPSEVPRVKIEYSVPDSVLPLTLQLSRNRIDFFFSEISPLILLISEMVEKSFFAKMQVPINRVGLVKRYFLENPTLDYAKQWIKNEDTTERFKEIAIRINWKNTKVMNADYNNVEEWTSGQTQLVDGTGDPIAGFLIMRDINTATPIVISPEKLSGLFSELELLANTFQLVSL